MCKNKANEILRRIEGSTYGRYLPIIGQKRGLILSETVRKHAPKRILEVGTLVGYSTILMGKELGIASEIISLEFHEKEAEEARANILEAMLQPHIEVLVGDAREIIAELEGTFDLVFLDAAKNQYLDYLRLVEEKLHSGSVIIADNAGWMSYSMRDYLDYVRNSGKYRSDFVQSNGDGIEISIKL